MTQLIKLDIAVSLMFGFQAVAIIFIVLWHNFNTGFEIYVNEILTFY